MLQHILQQVDQIFQGVLEVVRDDLSTVKTGRAKPDLVANLQIAVQSYGSTLKLLELANISAPDSQTLSISPWDKNVIEDISRGISKSDLNLNPVVDGQTIRISIPVLTQERRIELTKMVDKKVEGGKVLLREERQRIKKEIDAGKGKAGVSEDDIFKSIEELDKKTKEWEVKIDELGSAKKSELMAV
ncbi:ribosome recycling factor [Candidatus Collierbacteria bacterium]|nr:ribosome recycling factor [Candidatus Collierbacteria bacterium]